MVIDPLRVRSLSLRKRSLLRQYAAAAETFDESLLESTTAHRYVHFVKSKKKRKGRRPVRFAPLVDVYETSFPDDFTLEEFEALWISREDYEEARKEFSEVIMLLQTDAVDSAELLEDENNLPSDHPFVKHCVRGCEKYFDLPLRFRIRQVISDKILEFYRKRPDDPEALRVFSQALTAECSDLAFFHGQLNALQCWGTLLQKYQQLKKGLSAQLLTYSLSQTFSSDEEECPTATACGIEVVLDPSTKTGSRTLSVI